MNRKLLLVPFILLAIFLYRNPAANPQAKPYTVGGKTYELLLADAPNEWETGLMHRKKLNRGEGMVFVFPDKGVRTFWNKNTYLDLEVIWMSDDKIVGKSFLPSIEKSKDLVTVTSPPGVNKVVELIRD